MVQSPLRFGNRYFDLPKDSTWLYQHMMTMTGHSTWASTAGTRKILCKCLNWLHLPLFNITLKFPLAEIEMCSMSRLRASSALIAPKYITNIAAAKWCCVALSCSKLGYRVLDRITFMISGVIAALLLWVLPNFFFIPTTKATTLGLSVGGSNSGNAILWKMWLQT